MNHKKKLLQTFKKSYSIDDINDISEEIRDNIELVGDKISSQKGVFTVLTTLLTHKSLFPQQDIRKHQSGMEGGFSGRSIDFSYITPTLKELGLPSMAESGWLTRSLEQPYPYTLNYNGRISNTKVKRAFLEILDYVQKNPCKATNLLRLVLFQAIEAKKRLIVEIHPIENPELLTIEKITSALNEQFSYNYGTHGGSKLPVIAFYTLYRSLINELSRYEGCELKPLGSHTASDKTSKSAGDIEIIMESAVFEAIEIKLDKEIDTTMIRIAIEKIKRFNPERYYVLSHRGIKSKDKAEIASLIADIKIKHGCQIIINGIIPTLKYYLRLITTLEEFIGNYSEAIATDAELKQTHKTRWNKLIDKNFV